MAIFYSGEETGAPIEKPVLTIGTFDGVHLGHQLIFDEVKSHAARMGGESMVITFEPHPRQIIQPTEVMQILTPLSQKLALIEASGIRHIAVTTFTADFAQLSAAGYVEEFLVKKFNPVAVVIGYDHHFGHDRKGNIAMLREFGAIHNFEVFEIPAHMIRDAAISSSSIRTALLDGDVTNAAQMLGRSYTLAGSVVAGEQLGRTLGYPTANVKPDAPAQLVPAQGIYAVRVSTQGGDFGGMLSIGTRPTVNDEGRVSIEVYIFDFDEDIYGQQLTLHFIQRMRDELKFDSLEALKEALRHDEVDARAILGTSIS